MVAHSCQILCGSLISQRKRRGTGASIRMELDLQMTCSYQWRGILKYYKQRDNCHFGMLTRKFAVWASRTKA